MERHGNSDGGEHQRENNLHKKTGFPSSLPTNVNVRTFFVCQLQGCASPSFFVQLKPPFRDQNLSFTGHSVANPATNFTKQREGYSAEMRNTRKYNSQKHNICVFKCRLTCLLAPFEALRSLEKTIDDPTSSWSEALFFASCRFQCLTATVQKRLPSQSDAHFARSSSSEFQIRGPTR